MAQQTQPPRLDYAPPVDSGPPFPMAFASLLGIAALLVFPSFLVILSGAHAEPYFGTIRKSDAFVQVGLGTTLIFLWLAWTAALLVLVIRQRVPIPTLAMSILSALATFYLAHSVDGYVDDLIRAQTMNVAVPATSAVAPLVGAPQTPQSDGVATWTTWRT